MSAFVGLPAWAWFLVYALAVWRVSFMLVYDFGPWGAFYRLRERFEVLHGAEDEPISWPRGSLFSCIGCMAVWVALFLFPFTLVTELRIVLLILAGAAVAKLLQRWYEE